MHPPPPMKRLSNICSDLKESNKQCLSCGLFQRGKFVMVTDLTYLREAMGTFYDDSNIPITDIPTYTMPYKDFFTNGRFFFTNAV